MCGLARNSSVVLLAPKLPIRWMNSIHHDEFLHGHFSMPLTLGLSIGGARSPGAENSAAGVMAAEGAAAKAERGEVLPSPVQRRQNRMRPSQL